MNHPPEAVTQAVTREATLYWCDVLAALPSDTPEEVRAAIEDEAVYWIEANERNT